jgi:predicted ArsR family transcriptional regulator
MSQQMMIPAELVRAQKHALFREGWERTVWILNGLQERLGDAVPAAIEEMVAEDVRAGWARIAAGENTQTIDDLIRLLWEPLREKGFEFSMERTPDGAQMHVTRCPIAEIAKQLNAAEWLFRLTCATDEHSTAGFNPRIGFRRTKTLMEGADCCDHCYFDLDA